MGLLKVFKSQFFIVDTWEVIMRKHVYIDPKCLASSLLPSTLEEYNKEISGYLIGSNGKNTKRLRIVSAYPIQSDIKMPTWVEHGNKTAVSRVNNVMRALNLQLVGGFHSHPLGPSYPSRDDIEFVKERLEDYGLSHWLEMIVSVKKRSYKTRHKPGWYLQQYKNKIGLLIKTSPWVGYNVTLSGHWISGSGRMKEATLWTSTRHNF